LVIFGASGDLTHRKLGPGVVRAVQTTPTPE
jgi:glucose-6-phosphate 1-dehydrogenase